MTLQAVASEPIGSINSRFGPWTRTIDLKASKGLGLRAMNAQVYLTVLNLHDEKNAIEVFTGTGSATSTGYFDTSEGKAVAQGLRDRGLDPNQVYGLALQDQGLFGNPRMIRAGLRLGF